MTQAIIFDCEWPSVPGAPQRFWCGPKDPDRQVVQIGALALSLDAPFEIDRMFDCVVAARDRTGALVKAPPFFTQLTGITSDDIAAGQPLATALTGLAEFARGARLWSWGKDEIEMIAISCWLEGLAPPLGPERFGNAAALLHKAGQPLDVIHQTRSPSLPALYGIEVPQARAHHAPDDARGVALVVQHLLRTGLLAPQDLL